MIAGKRASGKMASKNRLSFQKRLYNAAWRKRCRAGTKKILLTEIGNPNIINLMFQNVRIIGYYPGTQKGGA